MKRLILAVLLATVVWAGVVMAQTAPQVEMYKSPYCG